MRPFLIKSKTLNPAWINNNMFHKVQEESTHPVINVISVNPKLHRLYRWRLGVGKFFHRTLYNECNLVSMLRLKLFHGCKRWTYSTFFLLYCIILLSMQQKQFCIELHRMYRILANVSVGITYQSTRYCGHVTGDTLHKRLISSKFKCCEKTFCSLTPNQNFSHITTVHLPWHVKNWNLILSLFIM